MQSARNGPFNPRTEIHYQLPEATHVTLTVYNLLGQKIRSLIDEHQESGAYTVHWDGCDENGSAAASGVYLYAISAGEFRQVKKMVLVRWVEMMTDPIAIHFPV